MRSWLGLAALGCQFNSLPLTAPDAGAAPASDAGCAFPGGTIVESSAHVSLAYPPNASVCTGTIDYLEATALAQAELLGVDLGTICYTVWQPDAWVAGPCPNASACTEPDGTIAAPRPDVTHELVHAMRKAAWTVPLFEEGIAVALGDDGYVGALEAYGVEPSAMLVGAEAVDLDARYHIAGDLTAYLLASRGPAAFRELLAALPRDLDAEARAEAFRRVYLAELDDVVADRWQSGWRFEGGDLGVPECAGAPVPWDGERWQDTWTVACHDGGIGIDADLRPLQRVGYVRKVAAIDVPVDGVYRLDVDQSRLGAWLELGWCPDPGGGDPPYESLSFGSSSVEAYVAFAQLRRGRYSLTSWASWPEPALYRASLERALPSCAAPLAIDDAAPPLFLVPHPSAPLAVTIRPASDRVLVASLLDGVTLSVCPDCAACSPVDEDAHVDLAAGVSVELVASAVEWDGRALLQFRAP
jgi:hypothetical protein